MPPDPASPLASIESRLRHLLPADLYAHAWVDSSSPVLAHVLEHLRTLHRILQDYVPREVAENPPKPGETRYHWEDGTLMFTDLAGFTPLMEANASLGRAGAATLLSVLNSYFAEMLEILSKGGGNLLEFTGDALLAVFPSDNVRRRDTVRAVRAGLRMQRAMARFAKIETGQGELSLGMRLGLHTGRFLVADVGTPLRMEHVLLGSAMQKTKRAEGAGKVGRVCLTATTREMVGDQFRFEPGDPGYVLVVDDLTAEALGEYELSPVSKRSISGLMLDRSVAGLITEIERTLGVVEPLACYLPLPVLNLVIESTARRRIAPDFPAPTVIFVNLIGLAESVDRAQPEEAAALVTMVSRIVALINAAIEARGGVLKKVTCHLSGYDMMIYFGVPNAHTDDALRAVQTAAAIREAITTLPPLMVAGKPLEVSCKIGLAHGSVFAAEIGEPRGRREFNVLGDPVNTAARLMSGAATSQILMTESVYGAVSANAKCESLGLMALKGKTASVPIFALDHLLES